MYAYTRHTSAEIHDDSPFLLNLGIELATLFLDSGQLTFKLYNREFCHLSFLPFPVKFWIDINYHQRF